MVLTRTEAKDAFNHVLDVVLGRPDNTPLKLSLLNEGIDNIFALTTITLSIIDNLKYEDSKNIGTMLPVKKGDKNLVKVFLHYIIYYTKNNCPSIGND